MREEHYLLKYFGYQHLPEHLQGLSKPFHDMAVEIEQRWGAIVDNRRAKLELDAAMRKLLETKDCVVRAGV